MCPDIVSRHNIPTLCPNIEPNIVSVCQFIRPSIAPVQKPRFLAVFGHGEILYWTEDNTYSCCRMLLSDLCLKIKHE